MSLTGRLTRWAISVASRATSVSRRRPKPPPTRVVLTVTARSGSFSSAATVERTCA